MIQPDKLMSIAFDSDKHFAEELRLIIQMFDNRHATGDPLTANEIFVQIPREKYERLCRLSLKTLQQRYKQSDNWEQQIEEILRKSYQKWDMAIQSCKDHPSKTSDKL